jgi:hypothetical protein
LRIIGYKKVTQSNPGLIVADNFSFVNTSDLDLVVRKKEKDYSDVNSICMRLD